MIDSLMDYYKEKAYLSIEEMGKIHQEMKEEIGDDPDALELYEELIVSASTYSEIRTKWNFLPYDEQAKRDAGRTSAHDVLIVKFNQLARFLKQNGHAALWRNELENESHSIYGRKRIGDMGCYLVFIQSINSR